MCFYYVYEMMELNFCCDSFVVNKFFFVVFKVFSKGIVYNWVRCVEIDGMSSCVCVVILVVKYFWGYVYFIVFDRNYESVIG